MQVLSNSKKAKNKRLSSPVDPACDRALVRKHTRYSPLVLGGGTSDERRVVDDTVLGSVTLGLERSEESLEDTEKNTTSKLSEPIKLCASTKRDNFSSTHQRSTKQELDACIYAR